MSKQFRYRMPRHMRCFYCPEMANTRDHIIPAYMGGAAVRDNMVYACQSCNNERGPQDFVKFCKKKGADPELAPPGATVVDSILSAGGKVGWSQCTVDGCDKKFPYQVQKNALEPLYCNRGCTALAARKRRSIRG